MSAVQEKVEPRTYFCPIANYCVSVVKGQIMMGEDRVARRMGEKFLQFSPMANLANSKMNYGRAVVDDPEVIAWVESHRAELAAAGQRQDILTPDEFNNEVIPAEERLRTTLRQLEDANRLLAELQGKGQLPPKNPAAR